MSTDRLGSFLREVSNWTWDEFVRAEKDKSYTSNEAMIFALIRSCAMQKMDAIKMSLNRLDGKLKTPIRIETPSVYFLYPNASEIIDITPEQPKLTGKTQLLADPPPPPIEDPEVMDVPSMSLRETLTAMADAPRELPEAVLALAEHTEMFVRGQASDPGEYPMVKSVVAAHLLILAQKRDIGALTEVFDQIDGKLAETIQLIGDDIYITSYVTIAPEGATRNADGIFQMEAKQSQDLWAAKLGATRL
jgi:hypothetical protein